MTTTAFAAALKPFLAAARGDAEARPGLILLGDVLELQFSRREDAFAAARTFLEALQQTDELDDRVIATAGNHDHMLWTDARLSLEAHAFSRAPTNPEYRKATAAFEPTPEAESRLLSALIEQSGFAGGTDLRYPNLGFSNDRRAVLLHHGHFLGGEYRLMSSLKDRLADDPRPYVPYDDLAAENAGWIDFFWSTLGDAAGLGRSAEQIYQNLLTSTGFRRLTAKWSEHLTRALAECVPMGGRLDVQEVLRRASQVGLDVTLGSFRDSERYAQIDALSDSGYDGLRWYLNGPVYHQLEAELPAMPGDFTFAFGHTHKPFSERIGGSAFAAPVMTYNTGGWTLNGPRLDTREGAAMLLIDEDLNCALLRLFATPENGVVRPAYVEILDDNAEATAFREEIETWLADDAVKPAFEALASAVGDAYRKRQDILLKLTRDPRMQGHEVQAAE